MICVHDWRIGAPPIANDTPCVVEPTRSEFSLTSVERINGGLCHVCAVLRGVMLWHVAFDCLFVGMVAPFVVQFLYVCLSDCLSVCFSLFVCQSADLFMPDGLSVCAAVCPFVCPDFHDCYNCCGWRLLLLLRR